VVDDDDIARCCDGIPRLASKSSKVPVTASKATAVELAEILRGLL